MLFGLLSKHSQRLLCLVIPQLAQQLVAGFLFNQELCYLLTRVDLRISGNPGMRGL
jgi:hypothetical protein